jgi:hypothetical protein
MWIQASVKVRIEAKQLYQEGLELGDSCGIVAGVFRKREDSGAEVA